MAIALLALVCASAFSGAAIYVLAVEHVARESLDDRAALIEWTPAYKRGTVMQGALAVVTACLGAVACWQTGNLWFGLGALLALLPWPWTVLVIMPTNKALLATSPESAGPETRTLLRRWAHLHTVRVALGCAATIAFFVGLL